VKAGSSDVARHRKAASRIQLTVAEKGREPAGSVRKRPPAALDTHTLMRLQGAAGNAAVARMVAQRSTANARGPTTTSPARSVGTELIDVDGPVGSSSAVGVRTSEASAVPDRAGSAAVQRRIPLPPRGRQRDETSVDESVHHHVAPLQRACGESCACGPCQSGALAEREEESSGTATVQRSSAAPTVVAPPQPSAGNPTTTAHLPAPREDLDGHLDLLAGAALVGAPVVQAAQQAGQVPTIQRFSLNPLDWAKKIWNGIRNLGSAALSKAKSLGSAALNKATEFGSGVASRVGAAITGALSAVAAAARSGVAKLGGAAKSGATDVSVGASP